jgi:Protein of unknown function (DUF2946)
VIGFHRAHLRCNCWFALFAILALALLPTASHALASGQRGEGGAADWAVICTPAGLQQVASDSAPSAPGSPAGAVALFGHCPYCSLGADAPVLPAAPSAVVDAPRTGAAAPAATASEPRARFAWGGAQPRAPPQPA